MITEQYVTFDTAKMLKEAGFDIPCQRLFLKGGCPGITDEEENHNDVTCNSYSRPTQQLAARWMREVHKLHIVCETLKYGGWFYCITKLEPYEDNVVISESNIPNFEEALEAGLQECLKLIIKNKENEKDNV